MSLESNTTLIEEAQEFIDYFEGKLPAEVMRQDIETGDLDSLAYHIGQARAAIFELEYAPEATDVE